ncbi:MAG: ferredoxin [Candidatus Sungbacteria bacterium]|nr:ferredoxin [Candidatus Sungbacteria bacterium]
MDSQADAVKKMKVAKIMIDRNLCIGAASCVAVIPGIFELDSENKAVLRRKDGTSSSDETKTEDLAETVDDDMILLAAKSCPTMAIKLFDEDGKQIYP